MFISSKPYKQWCRARGIDFAFHLGQYPLVAMRLTMPQVPKIAIKKLTLWEKIKNFFNY
uniref:Uncharacterized protein n=1 Tax=viral metagenome TaxID=1070528 RepID=A0A6M3KEA3_9ZZZZ